MQESLLNSFRGLWSQGVPPMGQSQSQSALTYEENMRLREYSVYCALLIAISKNTRSVSIEGLSPEKVAQSALESMRLQSSSRDPGPNHPYDA